MADKCKVVGNTYPLRYDLLLCGCKREFGVWVTFNPDLKKALTKLGVSQLAISEIKVVKLFENLIDNKL